MNFDYSSPPVKKPEDIKEAAATKQPKAPLSEAENKAAGVVKEPLLQLAERLQKKWTALESEAKVAAEVPTNEALQNMKENVRKLQIFTFINDSVIRDHLRTYISSCEEYVGFMESYNKESSNKDKSKGSQTLGLSVRITQSNKNLVAQKKELLALIIQMQPDVFLKENDQKLIEELIKFLDQTKLPDQMKLPEAEISAIIPSEKELEGARDFEEKLEAWTKDTANHPVITEIMHDYIFLYALRVTAAVPYYRPSRTEAGQKMIEAKIVSLNEPIKKLQERFTQALYQLKPEELTPTMLTNIQQLLEFLPKEMRPDEKVLAEFNGKGVGKSLEREHRTDLESKYKTWLETIMTRVKDPDKGRDLAEILEIHLRNVIAIIETEDFLKKLKGRSDISIQGVQVEEKTLQALKDGFLKRQQDLINFLNKLLKEQLVTREEVLDYFSDIPEDLTPDVSQLKF